MRTNPQPRHSVTQSLTLLVVVILIVVGCYACKHQQSLALSPQDARATQSGDDDFAVQMRRDVEPKLKSVLPIGWTLTSDRDSITLTRGEKVFLFSSLQWPAMWPVNDETIRKYGQPIVYRVTLRLVPRLNQKQYAALKKAWLDCHVDNPPGPTFSIEKWEDAQNCYHAKQPPAYYTDTFSIYVDQPDWWSGLRIYPEAAANESNKLHTSLDQLFGRYENAVRK
jgi:hypothetical protein